MARSDFDAEDFVQFVDDEQGYINWLESLPHGFVVNSARSPSPSYLVLHRASCKHINSSNWTNWTSTDLIKTCSDRIECLAHWARREVGGDLRSCGMCKPGYDPAAAPRSDSSAGKRQIPTKVATGCPELDLVWATFAQKIVHSPILIPDTEDDLNWHAFLGHAFDMQGFRAAEFVGVDALTRPAPDFVPLKTSGIGIAQLAGLWEVDDIRTYLLSGSKGQPLSAAFDLLEAKGGSIGKSLAEAFRRFGRCRFQSTVRALLQNSAALKDHDYSFRHWLQSECANLGVSNFPPTDFRAATDFRLMTLEMALRERLQQTFYQVGPALAPYMICDWQLWLWNEGRTGVFANFKLDSFHETFVERYGRGLIPKSESDFADWWLSLYPDLPPRMANECIWLGMEEGIV